MSVQGPLARSVADVRLALSAMAQADMRDATWMPVPLTGPELPAPGSALRLPPRRSATRRPKWSQPSRPPANGWPMPDLRLRKSPRRGLAEAQDLWHRLVINEERRVLAPMIRKFGDARSRYNLDCHIAYAPELDGDAVLACFEQRLAIMRAWQLFQEKYPVIILPVSAQLPFRFGQDQEGEDVARAVIHAQRSLLAIPALGFPSLAVPTGIVGGTPVGVQVVAGRFREDVCFAAAEVIEARASTFTPIDPR